LNRAPLALLPLLTACGTATAQPPVAGSCSNAPAFTAHTYHPVRLQTLSSCQTASGTIEAVRHEADGDRHVLLRLDPQYDSLLNGVNLSATQGDLILEAQCVDPVTQADAVQACQGSPAPAGLELLTSGRHVVVSGPYVLDLEHGWNEIHPVLEAKE
jgi:hypothetical protein